MTKIFISYRSLDSTQVDAIVARLRSLKTPDGTPRYEIWQDKTSIVAGEDWWQSIVKGIIKSEIFVFMLSRESALNPNCRAELTYARKRGRHILPLVLSGQFGMNPKTGKNDIDYWNIVPNELNEIRAQFLFDEGTSLYEQFQNACDAFRRKGFRDFPTDFPPDPRHASDETNDTGLIYDQACDLAYGMDFPTAERLFQRLLDWNDDDFGSDSHEWIVLLRAYDKMVRFAGRETNRYRIPDLWDAYLKLFPKRFIAGIFDPADVMRYSAKTTPQIEQKPPTPTRQTPLLHNGEGLKPQDSAKTSAEQKPKTQPKSPPPTQQTPPLPTERGQGGEDVLPPWLLDIDDDIDDDPFAWMNDPVQDALTRVRDFIKTGKRNTDWKPFFVTFSDLKIPDVRFCLVPTGSFQMGEGKEAHNQTFAKPFYLAQYPVTNTQWEMAVRARAVKEPQGKEALKWYNDPQMANAPVVGVSWHECQKFVAWAGCRLPTEREWEYAARGLENLKFAWGNDFIADNVVYRKNSGGKPNDVTSKPEGASWVGASQLSGNVWEWTASVYLSYPYTADGKREQGKNNTPCVLRGGSWDDDDYFLRAANRKVYSPDFQNRYFGFRCARS